VRQADTEQGYTYSVFNLVYESNTASTRIWDSLGFKRIGRVPGCGKLKSSEEPVDAIIYGRDLGLEGENDLSEERFDKIRYYLRHQLYPQGADRAEKSRLRSAATHYKLVNDPDGGGERLFLKDKEVISDPAKQYEIAKDTHLIAHGGINKTTAVIATQYHWIRIKETVSQVIKNCPECKDVNKPPILRNENRAGRSKTIDEAPSSLPQVLASPPGTAGLPTPSETPTTLQEDRSMPNNGHITSDNFASIQQPMDLSNDHDHLVDDASAQLDPYDQMAIDPQIMEEIEAHLASAYDNGDSNPYVNAGIPNFADASHMQTHHDPADFNHQPAEHHFMPNPTQQLMTPDHAQQMMNANHTRQMLSPDHTQQMMDPNHSRQMLTPDHTQQMMSPDHTRQLISPDHTQQLMTPDHTQQIMPQDHVMNDGNGNGTLNMQPMQNVLPMDYLDPQTQQRYKLEQ
jgi:hypothetical protein